MPFAATRRLDAGLAVLLWTALHGCAPPVRAPDAEGGASGPRASVAVDRGTCASEAVLLGRSVSVLVAPASGAGTATSLPRHAPVYLCAGAGGYRGIVFPAPGQRAVCGSRAGGAPCLTGWVREPVPVEVAG